MHVYIVDDDEALGRTVGRYVARGGWSFTPYTSAEAFLDQVDDLPFGCLVLDIKMPGIGGIELLELMHTRCPDWPIIMMSGYGEVTDAIRSFRHGAIHFLLKPFERKALLSVLQEAAQIGHRRNEQAAAQREALLVKRLSKRETEVLLGLADGHPSKAIAWNLGISTRTVEMHRSNIMSKLGARNTSHAAAIAHRCGGLTARPEAGGGNLLAPHKALALPSS